MYEYVWVCMCTYRWLFYTQRCPILIQMAGFAARPLLVMTTTHATTTMLYYFLRHIGTRWRGWREKRSAGEREWWEVVWHDGSCEAKISSNDTKAFQPWSPSPFFLTLRLCVHIQAFMGIRYCTGRIHISRTFSWEYLNFTAVNYVFLSNDLFRIEDILECFFFLL